MMSPTDETTHQRRSERAPATSSLRFVAREDLTEHLAWFRFEPEGETVRFCAGQWMKLGLRDPTNGELVWRPYTIASAPEHAELRFYVRHVWKPAPGRMTSLLWRMEPGATVFAQAPRGHFTLEPWLAEPSPRTLVMVAGGTGLAPFLSQVEHLFAVGAPAHIVLCHGVSYSDELASRTRFEVLERTTLDPNGRPWSFGYLPTVSRPQHPRNASWGGHIGRVESLFESPTPLETKLGHAMRPERVLVMLCGYLRGIENVLAALRPLGFVGPRRRDDGTVDMMVDSFGAEG